MNVKVLELKKELKDLARRIKATKIAVKECQRKNGGMHGVDGVLLRQMQYNFRHKNIAYCLYRGLLIEQVERKNRDDNGPDVRYIQTICDFLKEGEMVV